MSSYANNPPQGRLVASFSYNADGQRIEKRGERGIERYTYDDKSVLSQRDGNNALIAHYTYGPNRLISLEHKTEGTQFYLTDALNSIVDMMTTDGLVQARYQYDAFGNKSSESGSSWNRFAFTGYEEDKETNLLYAKARYYDADTGRFLSQDAWHGENNTPPSLHKYLYAYQNPTVYLDPTGNNPVSPMDWASFGHDVGGLLVQEGIYVAAKLNGNEAVADLALEGMKEARLDAAMSTAGIVNPVPGTSSAYKAIRAADKLNDLEKTAKKANDLRKIEDKANDARKIEDGTRSAAQAKTEAKVAVENKEGPGAISNEVFDYEKAKSSGSRYIYDPRINKGSGKEVYRDTSAGKIVSAEKVDWPVPDYLVGTQKNVELKVGTKLDKFGLKEGSFASAGESTISQRSLPPGSEFRPKLKIEVIEPGVTGKSSIAAPSPVFKSEGGAEQFESDLRFSDLEAKGLIKIYEIK